MKEITLFTLERSRIAKFSCTVLYFTYKLNYCSHFGNCGSIHDLDKCVASSIGFGEVIPTFTTASKKLFLSRGSNGKFNSTCANQQNSELQHRSMSRLPNLKFAPKCSACREHKSLAGNNSTSTARTEANQKASAADPEAIFFHFFLPD